MRSPDKPGATSEAEWEYACRAGTTTTYSFGSDRDLLSHYGRYLHPRTSLGGTLWPNPRGLFDMHGNVWEWCQDLYQARLDDDQVDPVEAEAGSNRTLRGGGWDRSAWHCRSAYRHSPTPSRKSKPRRGGRDAVCCPILSPVRGLEAEYGAEGSWGEACPSKGRELAPPRL